MWRVEEIPCWAEGSPHEVSEDATGKQEARWWAFERLRAWTVHDPESDGLWARRLPFDRRPFAEELDDWKAALEEALREMAEMRLALASISRRYFEGREVLFGADREAVRAMSDALAVLADLYNRWPGADRERHDRGAGSERASSGKHLVDTSTVDEEAQRGAASLVEYLVDMAKAEAMAMMGDRWEAAALARRHLGFTG